MAKYLLLLIGAIYLSAFASAQVTNDSLIAEAVKTDSLFWDGYNRCDIARMMHYIPEDLEFYHDKGGITMGDSAFEMSIKNGLCSDQGKFRLRRAVVAGSEKPYPMMKDGKVYGVLMAGKHLFYLSQNGGKEHADGLAQYADLWLLRDGEWKLARVFSYDHGPAPYVNERTPVRLDRQVLKLYAGKYKGPNTALDVGLKGDSLMITLGNRTVPLSAENKNLFFVTDRDLTFEFIREGNATSKMIVRENGNIVEELVRVK